jgi:hypothetical protein
MDTQIHGTQEEGFFTCTKKGSIHSMDLRYPTVHENPFPCCFSLFFGFLKAAHDSIFAYHSDSDVQKREKEAILEEEMVW